MTLPARLMMVPEEVEAGRALIDDHSFDALYPPHIQKLSRRHWTPVAVARRAAELLRAAGARNVLDVGSGAGKFVLVAAAAAADLAFVGVEQRVHLLAAARRVRGALRLSNARFVCGDVTRMSWNGFDGIYLFNPFGENLLPKREWIDDIVALSKARFREDVLRCEQRLGAAPVGTAVVTFDGSGGYIPSSYELAHQEHVEGGPFRLWIKTRAAADGAHYAELHDTVMLCERRI